MCGYLVVNLEWSWKHHHMLWGMKFISYFLQGEWLESWKDRLGPDCEKGFPGDSVVQSTCQCWRPRFDPWVGKIPWRSNPLQYSCLGNSMDRRAWWASYSPWGHKRVGHDLGTKQQQDCEKALLWGKFYMGKWVCALRRIALFVP